MILAGLNGLELWGFLASLGVLALADRHSRQSGGVRPRLSFEPDGTAKLGSQHDSVSALALTCFHQLDRLKPICREWLADIDKPSDLTFQVFRQLASTSPSRDGCDLLAGLACLSGEEPAESTLCAANGASHQNLVQSMRDVLALVEVGHIEASLGAPWKRAYEVPQEARARLQLGTRKPTLRLDPADERLYALRGSNPTTTKDFKTELGAQALAIPAYALLPVVPRASPERAVVVASKRAGRKVFFSWPLWEQPAGLAAVRSLLWMGVARRPELIARGVFAALRVARVSGDKGKLSFGPSEGVW